MTTMIQLKRAINSNFIKQKRGLFPLLHLLAAILYPLVLVLYLRSRFSIMTVNQISFVFFELLAMALPLPIAIIASLCRDQEEKAGNYKNLISLIPSRTIAFWGQVLMAWLSFAVCVLVATAIFASGFAVLKKPLSFGLLSLMVILTVFLSLAQYMIYFTVSYLTSVAATLGIGMAGIIIAALCETSLGDRIWWILPWSWIARMLKLLLENPQQMLLMLGFLLVLTVLVFIWSGLTISKRFKSGMK